MGISGSWDQIKPMKSRINQKLTQTTPKTKKHLSKVKKNTAWMDKETSVKKNIARMDKETSVKKNNARTDKEMSENDISKKEARRRPNWRGTGVFESLWRGQNRHLLGLVRAPVLEPPQAQRIPLWGTLKHNNERPNKTISGQTEINVSKWPQKNSVLIYRRIRTCRWVKWQNIFTSSHLGVRTRQQPKED